MEEFMIQAILGAIIGIVIFGVSIAFHASLGVAGTFGLIAFLSVAFGVFIFTDDINWFD